MGRIRLAVQRDSSALALNERSTATSSSRHAVDLFQALTMDQPAKGLLQSDMWRDSAATVPPENKRLLYAVVAGPHILAIGQGRSGRAFCLQEGRTCPKHSKAFIVAAAAKVFHKDPPHLWYQVFDTRDEALAVEHRLHGLFGEIWIVVESGKLTKPRPAARYLWEELQRGATISTRLAAVMELVVDDGDAFRSALKSSVGGKLHALVGNYFKRPKTDEACVGKVCSFS